MRIVVDVLLLLPALLYQTTLAANLEVRGVGVDLIAVVLASLALVFPKSETRSKRHMAPNCTITAAPWAFPAPAVNTRGCTTWRMTVTTSNWWILTRLNPSSGKMGLAG